MKMNRRSAIKVTAAGVGSLVLTPEFFAAVESAQPFGADFKNLELLTTGEWWKRAAGAKTQVKGRRRRASAPTMDVPRDKVVAFAVYTHQAGVLKMTAQLYPLKPGEERLAKLEFKRDGKWIEAKTSEVRYPGWYAHFRVEDWDNTENVPYRVRHGAKAMFEGVIRRDPVGKNEIVVANLSCNSTNTTGGRPEIVENLRRQDPDLLFFGGDQTYRHTEHTAGWIEFGLQFRDIIRDRPAVCIPDDHDVGHGNVWGESGKHSTLPGSADGGYKFPVKYVNQVQRQQSWHLPDCPDPAPVNRGIRVYFTNITVGGVDFAVLEDRKFKSGPAGKIPQMGPRPDHINDPKYDPKTVDLPGLQLLGPRQEKFLERWAEDWTNAEMKGVLSQTAFCGAVHMHGGPKSRLLADLDCNGWPQTPSRRALTLIRRAWAVHLCGDQHLAVVVKHGIRDHGDGPYGFTGPALVNTIYGRWWHPLDEQPGPNPVPDSPLPWTGDFKDGLGNKISMLAYANPENRADEKKRSDGFGIARFNKKRRQVTFECWPRFCDVRDGDEAQFPGWPITIAQAANDGRKVEGYLPELIFSGGKNPVVQVEEEISGEVLYTVRAQGNRFQPQVYSKGKHTVKIGMQKADVKTFAGLEPKSKSAAGVLNVSV